MGFRWTDIFLTYSVTADQEAVGFPANRLKHLHPHPIDRDWRSVNTSTQTIVYDLGADVSLVGAMFGGINFVTLGVEYKTAAGSYTAFTGSPFTVGKWGDYYRHMIVQSVTARYVKETITSQATVKTGGSLAGVGYFKQGLFWPVLSLNTMSRSPSTPLRQGLSRPYIVTGDDAVPVGPFSASQEWAFENYDETLESELRALALAGRDNDILVYENFTDPAAVYIIRAVGDPSFDRHSMSRTARFSFKEQV